MLKHAVFTGLAMALLLIVALLARPEGEQLSDEESALFAEDDAAAFGESEVEAPVELERLLAIEAAQDSRRALIHSDGRADYYRRGARLAGGGELVRILDNAVLLRKGGVYHLLCCVSSLTHSTPPDARPELIDLRDRAATTDLARTYHQRLYRNPLSLIGTVDIETSQGHAGTVYRVFPGRDTEAFAAFGLEPGDTVLGLNGIALADERAPARLFGALADASYIALTLRRAGRDLVVLLALDESA